MADLVQTTSAVVAGTPAQTQDGTAGEAIDAGMPVYLKTSDNRWWKAQHDGTAAESGTAGIMISLNTAEGAGQPIKLWRTGQINLGATLAVGEIYCLSATPGKICPYSDVGAADFVTILGVAITADLLASPATGPHASGVAKAA